jgi:CubicO group peptidase (beta-lactamase class C family)
MRQILAWVGGAIVFLLLSRFAIACLLLLLRTDPAAQADERPASRPAPVPAIESADELVEDVRARHKVPGLVAALVRSDGVVAAGAAGVRKAGGSERVTIGDAFHIGSCTKAMTTTLVAMLVERGELSWDSTLGEVFSDQKEQMHPDFRAVTLRQLALHRSGLPEDRAPDALFMKLRALEGPMQAQRSRLTELVLAQRPASAPGSKMAYSNNGYAILGAAAEQVTGETWENLMRQRLFEPLGMTTAGFGPPGRADAVDAPWGHVGGAARLRPIQPGPGADNPAVVGPAGTVHCSILDWARFAQLHLRGARETGVIEVRAGDKALALKHETFATLHDDALKQEYAMGWAVLDREWARGRVLTHSGSNSMWFASVWIAPQRDAAILAACNYGGREGAQACDAAIGALIEKHLK